MKKLHLFFFAVLLTSTTFAQTPEKMSYQAVVRDSGDALVTNQLVGMQISILQTTASGTAVYVETQTPTTNVNGLVTLEIGTGNVVNGDFATIDWSADSYFIKTETDPTGGNSYTITGTSQLLSVPYALYAKTSGSSNYVGKSTTSINLGSFGGCMTYPSYGCASGTANLTTTTTLSYTAGMRVRVSETSNPTLEFIEGVIQSYDGSTMVITVDTLITSTSGTFTSWDINLGSGLPGVPGAMGTSDGKNILGSFGVTNPNGATNPSDYTSPIEGDEYTNRDTGESFIYNGTIWDAVPSSFQLTDNADDTSTASFEGASTNLVNPPAADGVFVWNQAGANGVWIASQFGNSKNFIGTTTAPIEGTTAILPGMDRDPIEGDEWVNSTSNEKYIYQDAVWNLLPTSTKYIGPWNAQTNTPTLSSGIGTKGNYYVVSTAGSTNINGINYWEPGHWIMFNGTVWEKVDYTDPVATGNTYAYSVGSDFIGSINQNQLYDEIVDEAGITSNLLDVDRIDDTIYIVFNSVLSFPELTLLDNIIANHIGDDDPVISLNTNGAYNTTMLIQSAQTDNRTITLPDATTILVGSDTSDILTNKTIDTANNTLILDAGDITTGLFSDARIAASNVTQHVGSLVHQSLSGTGTNTHAQIDTHLVSTANPHAVTRSQIGLSDVDNVQQIPLSEKGISNGVATLGIDGKIPVSQLPSSTISNNMVYSTSQFSTISNVYTGMSDMTTTPVAGTYMVSFSASGNASDASSDTFYSIFNDGILVSDSEREIFSNGGSALDSVNLSLHSQSIVTVNGSQTIDVRVKTTSGIFTVNSRNLVLLRLN